MRPLLVQAVEAFKRVIAPHSLLNDPVSVVARPLTAEEAIGHPEHNDYPLLKGKERMMEARFRGVPGQAYTDQIGNFEGTLADVLSLPMESNYHRAVLVATLNAVLRALGIIDKSCHCKDRDPALCAPNLFTTLKAFSPERIGMIGLQPRLFEEACRHYTVRVCDRDPDQIGRVKTGITIEPSKAYQEIIAWCDLILATGTTLVNNTIDALRIGKPIVFYGITISGTAKLLGLTHYCPLGR